MLLDYIILCVPDMAEAVAFFEASLGGRIRLRRRPGPVRARRYGGPAATVVPVKKPLGQTVAYVRDLNGCCRWAETTWAESTASVDGLLPRISAVRPRLGLDWRPVEVRTLLPYDPHGFGRRHVASALAHLEGALRSGIGGQLAAADAARERRR